MSDELNPTENRISRLEELVAHQALTIDELSDQLAEQWKIIDALRNKHELLINRFAALEEQTFDAPADARPPHY